MDLITYALSKKIASSAVSGVSAMSVDGTTLNIDTNDGQRLQINFPTPKDGKDGVSVINIDLNENHELTFFMSDGTEIVAGQIEAIKGDKGDIGLTGEKGVDGISPTITESASNSDTTYKLDITDVNGTFTTPNLVGIQGIQGIKGDKGDVGITYTPVIGTITTVESTSDATAEVFVDSDNKTATFNFAIPKGLDGAVGEKGEKGEQGTTYVPSIGTVNSVENNVSAKVSVSVNESTKQAVFSFDIPKGKNATTDTALNVNSNNAIANKIVTNKFNEIDTTLGDIETVLESLVEV